tara:strand:- start:1777 stop:2913 length:1137 start_codon:yes stop_codon:yes gene_type:complete
MNSLDLSNWKISNFIKNKNFNFTRQKILNVLPDKFIDDAYNTISSWPSYKSTPLISLNKLSKNINVKNIFYKDESKRFGLKSFKALGGAYAVENITRGKKDIIISTATAGNHGRSVAWGSQRLSLKCKIFISEYVSEYRANEMRKLGADVIRVNGNYEASLKECLKQSKKNNWQIVQDVAWENYELVPKLTMAGYSVMIKEITSQTNEYITHVFLQAGVGGMAAGVISGIAKYFKRVPKIIIVEPESADCVLKSVENGLIKKIEIKKESIMGGMSCGEVSLVPWKIIKNSVNMCLSISDDNIAKTVAMLANCSFTDEKIIGGECSAPGVISLIASYNSKEIKENLSLDENSNILLIGCEGNADENLYNKLLSEGMKQI